MAVRAVVQTAAAIAIGTWLVTGCGRETAPDSVSSADLQAGIAQKLAEAGTPSTWISCPNSLPAKVGATTRCAVTIKSTDSVTALLTTTQVDGGKINWEITEAQLTKEQLVKRVSALTRSKDVTCDSGLIGRVGNWTPCYVRQNGATIQLTPKITDVKGLALKVTVVEFMPSQQVQEAVKAKLTPLYGRAPDRVECKEDLPGIPGKAIACLTSIGGNVDDWVVTATDVSQGNINFDVARPLRSGGVGR